MHAFFCFTVTTCLFGAISSPLAAAAQTQPAPDKAKVDSLAHKLLAAAINQNALGGDELRPWHIKIEFGSRVPYGMFDRRGGYAGSGVGRKGSLVGAGPGTASMARGTVEEWHAGRYQWKRTYASDEDNWNGQEWRISKAERLAAKPKHQEFQSDHLRLRVARPVIDPMYQAVVLPEKVELTAGKLATPDGQSFTCISSASADPGQKNATEWILPTYCFDAQMRLRLVRSFETAVQYEDFQPYQGRQVARTVRVIDHGQLQAEMKVLLLEDFDRATDAGLMKPPVDATLLPYELEVGDPPLESVFEQGTTIPLSQDNKPFRGTIAVQAVIHKNGTVGTTGGAYGGMQNIVDAVSVAVSRWKYRPYLVDGQPVEVKTSIPYVIDGKPFVPSYERPASQKVAVAIP